MLRRANARPALAFYAWDEPAGAYLPGPGAIVSGRRVKLPSSFDRRHPRQVALLRIVIGVWLVGLTTFLCASGRWWGVLLAPFAALHFYLAFRLLRSDPR